MERKKRLGQEPIYIEHNRTREVDGIWYRWIEGVTVSFPRDGCFSPPGLQSRMGVGEI